MLSCYEQTDETINFSYTITQNVMKHVLNTSISFSIRSMLLRHLYSFIFLFQLWDMRKESSPVAIFKIHEHLRPKVCCKSLNFEDFVHFIVKSIIVVGNFLLLSVLHLSIPILTIGATELFRHSLSSFIKCCDSIINNHPSAVSERVNSLSFVPLQDTCTFVKQNIFETSCAPSLFFFPHEVLKYFFPNWKRLLFL